MCTTRALYVECSSNIKGKPEVHLQQSTNVLLLVFFLAFFLFMFLQSGFISLQILE